MIRPDIPQIDPGQLRPAEPAIEKKNQHAIIPLGKFAVNRLQKRHALIQGEILRQTLFLFRRVQVLNRVDVEHMLIIR